MSRALSLNATASQATAFKGVARNSSYVIPGVYDLTTEDSNWVLTSSFIIFTMQTGKLILKLNKNMFLNKLNLKFISH